MLRSFFISISAALFAFAAACSCNRGQAEAAPAAVEFAGEWGVRGHAPGQLDQPVSLAVGKAGRVFIADRGTGFVQKFEADGVPLLVFGDGGNRRAAAIAVDSGGAIYVADPREGSLSIFFPEGEPLRKISVAPQRGYDGPFGFSVDDRGDIYVPDPAGSRIQVFSPRGRLERMWRVASGGDRAARPAIAMMGPDGFLYVGDPGTERIVKFTRDGRQIASWGEPSASGASLLGLAVSPGYVFALRSASPRLEVWTVDGHEVLTDDLGGRLAGSATGHAAIAWGPRDGLLVLNPSTARVLRFRIHLPQDR